MRMNQKVEELIKPCLRTVAKREAASYFTKREVVIEVIRRANLTDVLSDVRVRYAASEIDSMVLGYIDHLVGSALRAHDGNGLRVYECYNVGNSQRRWRRFRSMTAADLRSVLTEHYALRDQIEQKITLYEAMLREMERTGPNATVGQVCGVVTRRLSMKRSAS
jgi:hypothetical protein